MKTIGIIGSGNMGSAIISRVAGKYKVIVCEKNKRQSLVVCRKFKVTARDLKSLVRMSDVIILAVKPQDADGVLKEIRLSVGAGGRLPASAGPLLISIAAGLTTRFIEKRLGTKARVIRTMPNMPAQIGEGITAICKGKHARKTDMNLARGIFKTVGETVIVKEDLMDAVTAVSGSGPAYVFLFEECLTAAAQSLGLSRALSQTLVKKTLSGSVHLLEKQRKDASVLRAEVTSPGGTTQAAVDVFMKNKIEKIFVQALRAARKRAAQLSRR